MKNLLDDLKSEFKDFDLQLDKNASAKVVYKKDDIEIVLTSNILKPEKMKATIQYDILKF